MSRGPSEQELQTQALLALDRRVDRLEDPPVDAREAARDAGLLVDLATAESNAFKRLTGTHNRWPDVDALGQKVTELEQRRAAKAAELQELRDREVSAPAEHADRLATWQIDGEQGPRPESELPGIREEVRERKEEVDALDRAVTRALDEQAAYFEKHRPRLVKDADRHRDKKVAAYRQKAAEAEQARAEALEAQRWSVRARLYPSREAMQEPPDQLAGGRKRALEPMGLGAAPIPSLVFAALRADADYIADAMTMEQQLAIEGRDPRQPPNTEWSDDPAARAERDKRTADWLSRR
jgi:hypothetical protein